MKRITSLFALFISITAFAQTANDELIIGFIINDPKGDCLHEMDSTEIKELLISNIAYINNHRVTVERKPGNTITIDPFGLCNEYRSISIRYYRSGNEDYMFVYRRYAEVREEYGELQLYSKVNGTWQFGQNIKLGWQNFFSISKEEIDRLRNLNQYPTYLISFKENGIEFSIPWELYSFDQGSEINGYVQGNGSQPITLSYENLLP